VIVKPVRNNSNPDTKYILYRLRTFNLEKSSLFKYAFFVVEYRFRWVFENTFNYRIYEDTGKFVFAERFVTFQVTDGRNTNTRIMRLLLKNVSSRPFVLFHEKSFALSGVSFRQYSDEDFYGIYL